MQSRFIYDKNAKKIANKERSIFGDQPKMFCNDVRRKRRVDLNSEEGTCCGVAQTDGFRDDVKMTVDRQRRQMS